MDHTLTTQLKATLSQSSFPLPSPTLLTTLLSTNPTTPSLPRLTAQAKSHLLTSSLTTPSLLDPSVPSFPPALLDPAATPRASLPFDVPLQIVDIEDVSRPRWEQIEELERVERGELKKGRAIVRVEDDDDDDARARATQNPQPTAPGGAPPPGGARGTTIAPAAAPGAPRSTATTTHKVTLQDRTGLLVPALELARVPRLGVGVTRIGEKVVLRKGTQVARGTVLLEPATLLFLGGYVEEDEKRWVAARLGALRAAVGAAGPR